MFFIVNTGQPAPKGVQLATCHGPYSSRDDALDAFKAFTQPGTYALYGPAEATGDQGTIDSTKPTMNKANK